MSIDVHELDGQDVGREDLDRVGAGATGSLTVAADHAVTSVRAATARRRQHRPVDVLFAGTPTSDGPASSAPASNGPPASAAASNGLPSNAPAASGSAASDPVARHATASVPAVADVPPARTGQRSRSLVLSSLQVAQDGAEAVVSATLRTEAGTVTGSTRAIASRTALLRAVATAVLRAVQDATDGVVRGELVTAEVGTELPAVATAVVELVGTGGRTRNVAGAAVVGDAPHQAMARATLDAVDRSLPWLAER